MRVLFTTPILEHPAAGGPQLRIENSIKALAAVCELDIVSRAQGSPAAIEGARGYFSAYCSEFRDSPREASDARAGRFTRKLQRALRRLLKRDVAAEAAFIVDHADRRRVPAIWFGYGNISYPLIWRIKSLRPRLKLVCDTDSVWSRFIARELPFASGMRKLAIRRAAHRKEIEERHWVNLCDVTTAVSDVDADYYRGLAAETNRIHVFSNVIDVDSYANVPAKPAGFSSPAIYLAGTFWRHSPMEQATRWFVEDVFPNVVARVPDVHLYVVGRGSDSVLGDMRHSRVTVTGLLPSVLPYLCHSRVALVPLQFESGTRFKILEAGACGVPVVSTSLGAEGIPVIDGVHALIADGADKFSDAVIRVLKDSALAARLSRNCRQLVQDEFSIQSSRDEARTILEYLHHG